MTARSEIVAIWPALKQPSENKNDPVCVRRFEIQGDLRCCFPFVKRWHLT